MNIWHLHEHKLLKPRFIAFGLSFRLHFQQQFISPSFSTMRFLHSVAVLLSPGFAYDGTQSTFHLSHRWAALPEWKFSPHTRSYSTILSVRLSRLITLMAVSHLRLRSADKNLRFFALILYNFRHPTKSKILSLRFFVRTIKN